MAQGGRIGIFGGTFDPLHVGHLTAAAIARQALGLDEVHLVVANEPWQKANRRISPAQVRFEAVAAGVRGMAGLVASATEIERGGPSYSIDTVVAVASKTGRTPILIMGADSASGLDGWHRAVELSEIAEIAVLNRPGVSVGPLGSQWRTHSVAMPPLDVSSTWLREQLAGGRTTGALIPLRSLEIYEASALYR